jgi:hypothetical protein
LLLFLVDMASFGRRATSGGTHNMSQLLQIANLASDLIKNANTIDKASTLIQKWSHKDLGPANEWLTSAAHWEARNQVFGWGK